MTSATHLLRQVHPNFAPAGELTSQAFFPFPKDEGKLSVYDGDQITPRESHHHYTTSLKYESIGVWGVTCEEVASVGLNVISDPLAGFVEHAVIDFGKRDEKTCRKLAKKLRAAAVERGPLFTA